MAFSEQTLAEIRARTDIVEFISANFPLKRAGANFVALCPFHNEKTPSFSVSPQKQIFYCFGCHVGGDVFKFVMLRENLDFPAAVRLLAERASVQLREDRGAPDAAARSEKEQLYKLHEQACDFYQEQLAQNAAAEIARRYLAKRDLSAESVKLFRLGYAPDAWDATLSWATARKFPPTLIERAGLAIRRESDERFYDRFRGRLMFAICDEQGRVVGFSGRVLADDPQAAKYVNSPETPIFQKGKILFGLDKTKRAILEAKFAVICEGQIDLISCVQRGVGNLVAPQGTAFTTDHGRILKRYVDEVVLCFDSDAAGQNAAVRSLDALLESGLIVRVATLPAGHDPDTLVRKQGVESLRKLIAAAPSYFDFRLEALCHEHNAQTDVGRSRIARALLESVAKVSDAILRDRVLQQAAKRLGVREEALREELKKQMSRHHATVRADRSATTIHSLPARKVISTPEKELLHLLVADESGAAVRVVAEVLDPAALPDNECGQWIGKILELAAAKKWHGAESLRGAQEELMAGLVMTPLRCPPDGVAEAAREAVKQVHRVARRAEIERVRQALRSPQASARERERLERLLLDLQR